MLDTTDVICIVRKMREIHAGEVWPCWFCKAVSYNVVGPLIAVQRAPFLGKDKSRAPPPPRLSVALS